MNACFVVGVWLLTDAKPQSSVHAQSLAQTDADTLAQQTELSGNHCARDAAHSMCKPFAQ
jgi:hypothetical protein